MIKKEVTLESIPWKTATAISIFIKMMQKNKSGCICFMLRAFCTTLKALEGRWTDLLCSPHLSLYLWEHAG